MIIRHVIAGARISLLIMGLLTVNSANAAASNQCRDLLPKTTAPSAPRGLVATDLVRLRDIGSPESSLFRYDHPIAISPEERRIAFVIRRADPTTNTYCNGLIVLNLATKTLDLIDAWRGFLAEPPLAIRQLIVRSGMPAQNRPAWRPDGRALAWLKRTGSCTEAWVVDIATKRARLAIRIATDAESVDWSADGHSLVIKTRPEGTEERTRRADEARRGFRYDDRFMPNQGSEPLLMAPIRPVTLTIHVHNGVTARTPVKVYEEQIAPPANERSIAISRAGRRAWIAKLDDTLFSDSAIWSTGPNGESLRCDFEECRGDVYALNWSDKARTFVFLARRGWKNEETTVYIWKGNGSPKSLYSTFDTLADCVTVSSNLICLQDGATAPRRLVSIDLRTGERTVLFDPNPEFQSITLGTVQRLRWKNANGLEAWGDLVLPPRYDGKSKLPLVVVQYHSDGFLRGGTGDELPIQLFATAGFAVLSLEQPNFIARILPGIRNWDDANREDEIAWRERRSLLSSLEIGVSKVVEMGVVDPTKIGLSGLSDGATTAQFALINSRTFAAVSLSSCCIDPNTVMIYGGERWARVNRSRGFPRGIDHDEGFWRPMSLALNASRVDTPVLMQLPSDEYLLGLESFNALRESGAPVEMYVFPNERHVKWQPAHRLAVYQRSLDWFNYWLRGQRNAVDAKREQYDHWDALRVAKQKISSSDRVAPANP